MSQPLAPGSHLLAVPQFYVTPRPRFSVGAFLLAFIIALVCLVTVLYTLTHTRHGHPSAYGLGSRRDGFSSSSDDDDDDDPNKVDTIYLGGPSEAPTPTRPGTHPNTVHPFIVIQLPRSGNQIGQIPDTPAGRLLYGWLAAFNGTDPSALATALPTHNAGLTEAAQVELRKETGGFTLLSAKEVEPGVLVFRLHDQTPSASEVLGTLQLTPDASPATIASFSLRAVPQPQVKVH